MRGEFYKMDFRAWNTGTVDLTLEQEAAYLRLCHAMYDSGGPIPESTRLLQGIFRCGNVKAAALVRQLVQAGKIERLPDGRLSNKRVTKELSERERLSDVRRAAGSRGGSAPRVTAECEASDGQVTTECGPSEPAVDSAKSLENNNVNGATATTPGSREDKRRGESPKAPTGAEQEGFAELWAAYPKRHGDNPRKPAFAAYVAALRRGAKHSAIMAGLRQYVAELAEDGKIGSRFVAQTTTWLNQDRFERPADQAALPSGPEPAESDYLSRLSAEDWRQHVGRWKSTGGHWILTSRTPPPDDRRTRVPPAILEEFGILRVQSSIP